MAPLSGHAYEPHLLKLISFVLRLRMLSRGKGRRVINYNRRSTAVHYIITMQTNLLEYRCYHTRFNLSRTMDGSKDRGLLSLGLLLLVAQTYLYVTPVSGQQGKP